MDTSASAQPRAEESAKTSGTFGVPASLATKVGASANIAPTAVDLAPRALGDDFATMDDRLTQGTQMPFVEGSQPLPRRGKSLLIVVLILLAIAAARLLWLGVSLVMFLGLMAFYILLFALMVLIERRSRG